MDSQLVFSPQKVLTSHPNLAYEGFGGKTPIELTESNLYQLSACLEIIRRYKKISPERPSIECVNSYELKHCVEAMSAYTANGVFILAMLCSGYVIKKIEGPNAFFCMPKDFVTHLRVERKLRGR